MTEGRDARRLLRRLAELWALAGGAMVLAIMAATTLNVAGFGLDRLARLAGGGVPGLPGYEDFVGLAVSAAALMFLPHCQAERGHVVVELFVAALPAAVRRGLDRLWLLLVAGIAGFLGWWMAEGMAEARADNVLTPVLGWPVWPFYAPGLVSLALWAAVALLQVREGSGDV